jgi:photosystem II stability/assembly factor-like uncharacterized protein
MPSLRLACASALLLLAAGSARAQPITIREINPTRSDTGGNAATGGRVNHLGRATDSVFYAASEFGGLFKSADAGRTWARLDSHLPTKTFDVKASPADPDRVVATSLYDGRVSSLAGINVSTDAGATWAKPPSASPPAGFCGTTSLNEPSAFGIAFDPDSPASVYVGTNCGLARSADGGQTWTFLNPGPSALATSVFGVVVHHGGIIDTCGFGGHRRSTDGGATWTGPRATGVPLPAGSCTLAASPDEPYVLFATAGTSIFETDDGGGTWNTALVNPSPQGRVPFVATNKRQGRNFDLWFGDVGLSRAACTTPAAPAAGGTARCPTNTWTNAGTGAHSDMGEVVFTNPPRFDVAACRTDCSGTRASCLAECTDLRDGCMSEVGGLGGPLASQCARFFAGCRSACTRRATACNAICDRPQEGCPAVVSCDGGVYFNPSTVSPACQAPSWTQPNVTPRALWLFSLDGANIPSSLTREALYAGAQDNGTFATLNAGAATPAWTNPNCCDSTDTIADTSQVVFSLCCFGGGGRVNRVFRAGAGLSSQSELPNYPAGNVPRGGFPEVIARFGTNRYALITTSGVFATQDVTASTITWTQLGTNPPTNACALWAAGTAASPSFFAMTGGCTGNFASPLVRYDGTSATGTWQNVALPAGATGVGVFAVDRRDASRLAISAFDATGGVHIFRSADGGATWQADAALDGLMSGGGTFRMRTSSYAQPTLVAFDPNDSSNLFAGSADAGLFLSRNGGTSWVTATSSAGDPANPVIPRPHWAYFDRECSRYSVYVGTQGRGAWRLDYPDPAGSTVSACQLRCDAPWNDCQRECVDLRDGCMSEVGGLGGPLASQCAQQYVGCRSRCSNVRNACRQRCVDCPQ